MRAMCEVQLIDRKMAKNLMLTLCLCKTIDLLAIAVFIGMVMCR